MTVYEMSVSAAILILAITVIRVLAVHKLPKITFLILWGAALCRLLIPFSVTSSWSVYAVFDRLNRFLPEPSSAAVTSSQQVATMNPIINAAEQAAPAAAGVSIHPVGIVWATGLIACALFFLITHLRFRRIYKTALPIDSPFIAGWLRSQKMIRPIQIKQLDRIHTPLTYGIVRPVIVLPKTTDWTDEKLLQYILTHEFVHIKRFDTLWKWLLAASLCIHWFNPLVWVMYVFANRDLELSCDEAVVRILGTGQKSAYAIALIGLAEKRSAYAPFCNNFSKNAIEERIKAIMKLKKNSIVGIAAALAVVIGVVIAFATTSPNGNQITAMPAAPNAAGAPTAGTNTVLKAEPQQDANQTIDITDLNLNINAKNISEAKNLVTSITGDGASNIVIKFQKNMDERTLNAQNILIFVGKNPTEFTSKYNAKSRELYMEAKLGDPAWSTTPVRIILTKNIKTSDGKFSDYDYVCLYRA